MSNHAGYYEVRVPANNRETCSHCHAMNDIAASRFCWRCGHNAIQPRILCDCSRCYGELEPPLTPSGGPKK